MTDENSPEPIEQIGRPTQLLRKLRTQFLTGIVVAVPIGATILILLWIFRSIDSILQPVAVAIWHRSPPGVGFLATLLLIYLAGVVAGNVLGKRTILWFESMLGRVPVVRMLYSGIKQILESFSKPGKTGFMQVVLIEFPRKGMKAIGFVTNEFPTESGEKCYNVLIPTAPNPTSGFLQIVRESDIIPTKIPIDEALRMVVSAGRLSPLTANPPSSPEVVTPKSPEQGPHPLPSSPPRH